MLLLLRATRASAALAAAARRKPTRLTAIAALSSSLPSSGGRRRKGQRRGEANPQSQPPQGETPSKKKPDARPAGDKKGRIAEAEAKPRPRHGEPGGARPAGDKKAGAVEAQGPQRQESDLLSKQQQQKPKRVVRWKCASGCGACCKLDKGPDFPAPEEVFADHPDDLKLYKSMIGSDGWCTNYNKSTRTCRIYQDRPLFCRVEPEFFDYYFGVPRSTFHREACSACADTIKMVYGQDSAELSNFKRVIREESNKHELSKKQDKLLDT